MFTGRPGVRRAVVAAAVVLALNAGVVWADPPRPNHNAEKNPVQTGSNSNNPHGGGQPQGAGGEGRDDGLGAVCGNGEHTHNPHCEVVSEPTPVVTPTVPTGAAAEPTAEVVGIQDAQGGAPEQAVAGQAAVAVTEIISMPPVRLMPVMLPSTGDALHVVGMVAGLVVMAGGWWMRKQA